MHHPSLTRNNYKFTSRCLFETPTPPYIEEPIDEDDEEDVIEDVYDVATRDDTQL